jgi:hypothetical protein
MLGIATVATAGAGATALAADRAPAPVQRVIGQDAVVTSAGLYRVAPAVGDPVLTHGPDARAATERPAGTGLAADGTGFAAGAVERQPACANDFYQHVVYAYVGGTPNRVAEATPEIRTVVGRMNAVLNAASIASGGPSADYKVLCDGAGQMRVDALTVPGASLSDIVGAARAAGFASDRADYLVFVDGELGGSCGIASYETDERLAPDNRSNAGGGYAAVYGPCWENETPMHESAHLMGAVQYGAPNSTGTGGHCVEDFDVLCYSPDGGDRNQGGMLLHCPDSVQFDCGFDDYFDSAPERGEYLDSHWNLGSPLNRFISFTGIAGGPPIAAKQTIDELGKRRGASGERGDWRRFKVRVRGHTRVLKIRLFAAAGADLALFVRRGKQPTREVYACRAARHGPHATCRIDDPDPGIWHAGVLTRGGRIGAGYKISARAHR